MKIGIIGAGTWGTALGQVLDDNGHQVVLYTNDPKSATDINQNHKNSFYFGDKITLSPTIIATNSLEVAVDSSEVLVLSVPTAAMRDVLGKVKTLLKKPTIFVNTAKGFDTEKNIRMSELIREIIPFELISGVVSLIGPSHAEEVIVRDLTCVCSVSTNLAMAQKVAMLFSNSYFRVYTNNDEVGAEIGVALKNAIAIASGILEGLKYGDNARAALCCRGLNEIRRFGKYFGGEDQTYLGLTGIGDLVVTCYSFHSRNFTAGLKIGECDSAEEFLKTNTKTVEGIRTIKVVYELSKKYGIDMPIIEQLYSIIYDNKKPSSVISALMNRPIKQEK